MYAGEESAHEKTTLAMSGIDKAVSKGIIHRNKGARLKSRLMKKLNRK
jgi:small subunit ribosomal protein S20